MLKLALLPGDLLAHLLRYHDVSHAVVELWKCGDKTLNAKMSNWVYFVHLEDSNPASTSRYPKMLSSLHSLRQLAIVRDGHIGPPSVISQELQKLSSTLMELELRSKDGTLHFRNFPPTDPIDSYDEAYLCLPLWNIAQSFPHLRKLIIWKPTLQKHEKLENFHFSDDLKDIWPPLLDHLELGVHADENTKLILPSSLRTLMFATLPSCISWPPNRTHLTGRLSFTPDKQAEILQSFPRSLTIMPEMDLTPAILNGGDLPLTLQKLRLFRFTGLEQLSPHVWMPQTLTHLDAANFLATASLILSLPNLTDLLLYGIDWVSVHEYLDQDASHKLELLWPRSLRVLELLMLKNGQTELDSDDIIRSLPTSLTELHILREEVCPSTWDYNLPNLFSLNLSLGTFKPWPTQPFARLAKLALSARKNALPQLDFLLSTPSLTDVSIATFSLSSDVPHFVSRLPRSLKTLYCRGLSWPNDDAEALWSSFPPEMTSLNLLTSSSLSIERVLPFLPAKLQFCAAPFQPANLSNLLLQSPCLANLRALNISWWSIDQEGRYRFAELLPIWPEEQLLREALVSLAPLASVDTDRKKMMQLVNRARMYPDPRILITCKEVE